MDAHREPDARGRDEERIEARMIEIPIPDGGRHRDRHQGERITALKATTREGVCQRESPVPPAAGARGIMCANVRQVRIHGAFSVRCCGQNFPLDRASTTSACRISASTTR